MTDEQLRAMARRVISEACDLVRYGCYYAGGEKWRCNGTEDVLADADAVDDAAVAIMREEMDKCPKCGSNDTLACCCECGVYWGKDGIREPVKITAAIYDPADDPTQSFVATT